MEQERARPRAIVILTGAGISAESGIKTFRASDGLWEDHPVEEVATPEGFARNPSLVHRFYNERRKKAASVSPNPAHRALAQLEQNFAGEFLLVTQNVDDLHERAGSKNLIHMHGSLAKMLCARCQSRWEFSGESGPDDQCPKCQHQTTRPDIVWFGEMPYEMERIYAALEKCDYFLSIGTSGNVYPAAGFAQIAARAGAHCLELNLEPSNTATDFHDARYGKAGELVPIWVGEILGKGAAKH